MKRTISVALALLLFMFAVPVMAQEKNLISCGDFEDYDALRSAWYAYGGLGGKYVSVISDEAKEGLSCIKLTSNDSSRPYIGQDIFDVTAGAEYTIKAWVKSDTLQFAFKMQFMNISDGGSVAVPGDGRTTFLSVLSDDWQAVSYSFRVPEGANYVGVLARIYGKGTAYVDEIEMYQSDAPPRFTLTTDEVFYYADMSEGTATLKPDTDLYPAFSSYFADIRLKHGEEVLKEALDMSLSQGALCFKFPLTLLSGEKGTRYMVEAIIKNDAGTEIERKEVPVYKYDRPKRLTHEGECIVDNEVFTPVIGYHLLTESYQEAAAGGINVAQYAMSGNYNVNREALEEAEENGMMLLACIYTNMFPAAHPVNRERIAGIVEAFKDDPRIFAWAIMDEPMMNGIDNESILEESYKLVRDIDSMHPVYILESSTFMHKYDRTAKYCDIFAVDPYSTKVDGGENYYKHVTAATVAANEKPVLAIVGTFLQGTYFPSGNEVRNMLWQSLLSGASGIGFYTYNNAYNDLSLGETPLWQDICSFTKNDLRHGIKRSVALKENVTGENVRYSVWRENKEYYVLAANRSFYDSTSFFVALPDAPCTSLEIFGGDPEDVAIQGDGLAFNLAPAQTILCKLSDNKIINGDFSDGLNAWSFSDTALVGCDDEKVSISRETASNQFVSQFVTLYPGKEYQLSFDFMCETQASPALKMDYGQSGYEIIPFDAALPREETKYNTVIRLPDGLGGSKVNLVFRNDTVGTTVYYDNIVLTENYKNTGAVFYKENTPITYATAGKITVKYVHVPQKISEEFKVIVAVYKKSGKASVLSEPIYADKYTVRGGQPIEYTKEVMLSEGEYIKVFIWDSILGIRPIRNGVKLI